MVWLSRRSSSCVRVAVEVEKGGPASETHPGFWVCVLCVWCAMTMA